MSLGNTWENEFLDHVLNNAAAPAVTTPYVSLHTGDPGETGANEASGGSYGRQSGSFGNASGGSASNDATISFADMPAATITHAAVWSSATATASANYIVGGTLTASKTTNAGDTFKIAIGALTVTMA